MDKLCGGSKKPQNPSKFQFLEVLDYVVLAKYSLRRQLSVPVTILLEDIYV